MSMEKSESLTAQTKGAMTLTPEQSWRLTLNGLLVTTALMTRKELTAPEILAWEELLEGKDIEA
jgi:hypothetical protein